MNEPDLVDTAFGCAVLSVAFAITVFTILGAVALVVNAIF